MRRGRHSIVHDTRLCESEERENEELPRQKDWQLLADLSVVEPLVPQALHVRCEAVLEEPDTETPGPAPRRVILARKGTGDFLQQATKLPHRAPAPDSKRDGGVAASAPLSISTCSLHNKTRSLSNTTCARARRCFCTCTPPRCHLRLIRTSGCCASRHTISSIDERGCCRRQCGVNGLPPHIARGPILRCLGARQHRPRGQ
mmetsp:Transcript_73405/g.202615  ORF Transcript_73405/g.202615 Transcript_73405/m.202615 type:complete len:202 (+) Transcript_73405:1056-1661(+)